MAQIEIIGNDNYLLIDDNFKNLILASKSTVTFTPIGGNFYQGTYIDKSIPSSSVNAPILAINSSFLTSVTRCSLENGNWIWTIACEPAGVGLTADVYIYQLPETVPDAGGLIQLRNSENKIVFDSNLKYMKMEKPFFITMDNATSTTVTGNRKYAAIHSKLPGFYSFLQGSMSCGPNARATQEVNQLNGTKMANGSVTSSSYILASREFCATAPFPSGGWRTKDGLCMIIDVTGV